MSPSWWDYGTQFKLNGSVPLPYETEVAFVLQNLPGLYRMSDYRIGLGGPAELASVEEQLGFPLATGEQIQLFPSGTGYYGERPDVSVIYSASTFLDNSTEFEPRLTQLDLRFAKIFNFGQARVRGWFDIYNVFNASAATRLSASYQAGGAFPRISDIMVGRLYRFGGQFDW